MLGGSGLVLVETLSYEKASQVPLYQGGLLLFKRKEQPMNHFPKKTTCESKGHLWQASTTSPHTMHCGRTGCKATQHFLNGVWIEAQASKPKPVATGLEQVGLWANG